MMAREQVARALAQQQSVTVDRQRQERKAARAEAVGTLLGGLIGLLSGSGNSSSQYQMDQSRREQELTRLREEAARREREAQSARLREEEERRRAQNEREQSIYDRLKQELAEAQSTYETASAFVSNPFRTIIERAGSGLNSEVMGASVEAAMPGTSEKRDRSYDTVADIAGRARSAALAGNPFAERVSGVAMEGVESVHSRTLGEVDRITDSIRTFGSEDMHGSGGSAGVVFRPSPPPRGGGGGTDANDEESAPAAPVSNPFAGGGAPRSAGNSQDTERETEIWSGSRWATSGSGGGTRVALAESDPDRPRAGGRSAPAPSATPGTQRYVDPTSRVEYVIPPEHVLYRDPATRRLAVVRRADLKNLPEGGDRAEQGEQGCGATGVGIVTPECETKRRQKPNPFAARK